MRIWNLPDLSTELCHSYLVLRLSLLGLMSIFVPLIPNSLCITLSNEALEICLLGPRLAEFLGCIPVDGAILPMLGSIS